MKAGGQRRERKVVTVVFCDLVGFTSQAESMDPEDVEAILRPYHARVRSELERHGGTVEKFIGDAVMALFGAPVAHEDDPERAVRAALAIRDSAVEDGLELRIGVTTGEALVSLDASLAEGEGMASGDVVNTAARLQSAAPVNGILVDGTTYRATRPAISYEGADPVEAKGKARPVSVWRPLEARARFGVDVAHQARAELVGRERELSLLRNAFARARHERVPQLVTLVGVPGIGKSRLVYELSRLADADPELITWRQGRCLAYGDGVTLWALGEIVKAQAGIVEQDDPATVAAKLRRTVEETLAGSGDEVWIESHLKALVGLGEEAELGGDRRSEAFSAWRRYLEGLAEQRPLILVFEDLHWADEALLDFVDELCDWVTDVPLFVVATARPELLERRPGWGGGKLNATTLALRPLSDEETAHLLGQLLDRPVLAAEEQRALLERAGGNPLYAEQFADLFAERGSSEDLPLPETLQGIIAARLDGLRGAEKELLQDASVVGKVFWASALGRGRDDLTATLHALERKGFVRRQRRSSVEGETEIAFAHALVRDVAYGQIARAERAAKHRRVAEWIESLGRPEDHAEMLAYHWSSALELTRAAGADDAELTRRASIALREAGDRAFALNAHGVAASQYEDALALWPEDDPERPDLLFRRARALHFAGDERRFAGLEEASDALLSRGDRETAAEAQAFLSHAEWYRGRRDAAQEHISRALELVAEAEPSVAKARVLAVSARHRMLAGDSDDAIRIANEALAIAEALDLDELRAHALATRGSSNADPEAGVADVEEALRIAVAASSPVAGAIANNLAVLASRRGELARAAALHDEATEIARRFGDVDGYRFTRGNTVYQLFFAGRWDEAMAIADDFIGECETSPHYMEGGVRMVRSLMRLARGNVERALDDADVALALAREIKDPQRLIQSLLVSARVHALAGDRDAALGFAREGLDQVRKYPEFAGMLWQIVLVAEELGVRTEMLEILEQPRERSGYWEETATAGARGDHIRARELFEESGAPALAAEASLLAGEALVRAGEPEKGRRFLDEALAFSRSVGATYFVGRAEALLSSTYSESA
jgi:class 3 adenylate cyclase/tetratricopeptide (TPR) repeat protein